MIAVRSGVRHGGMVHLVPLKHGAKSQEHKYRRKAVRNQFIHSEKLYMNTFRFATGFYKIYGLHDHHMGGLPGSCGERAIFSSRYSFSLAGAVCIQGCPAGLASSPR